MGPGRAGDRARDRAGPRRIGDARRGRAADAGRGLRVARLGVRRALGGRSTAAKTLQCVGTWHAPSLQVAEFVDISRTTTFTRGVGLPGPGLGVAAGRPGFRTSSSTPIFRARRGGSRRPARRVRAPDPARRRRARRDGVLQPRHPPARRRAARHDDDRGRADRAVRRPEVGGRRARDVLHAVARSALRRQPRRLLPPGESGVDARARLRRGGAARRRRSSISSIPTIAPRRSTPCRR